MTAMMLIGIEEKLGSQSLGVCLRILAEGGGCGRCRRAPVTHTCGTMISATFTRVGLQVPVMFTQVEP